MLAIPKLVHLLSVLPSPPKQYIDRLVSVLKRFIWNNKRARISYAQLCQKVEKGGLKLTHINTLIHALKISWIRRLLQGKGGWQDIFSDTITEEWEQIWELDLKSLDEFGNKIKNKFWSEVFISWRKYREERKVNKTDCLDYPIWNSSFCTVKGIGKLKHKLKESGLNYVKDLMDKNGTVLGYIDFKTKFGVDVNFVDFYSLMHCIPNEWKGIKKSDLHDKSEVKRNVDKLRETVKVCKYVYSILLQNVKYVNTGHDKWSGCGISIAEDEWERIYKIPTNVTEQSKLQSFQYQILKRCTVTNKYLHLCKIKDNNLCQFCKMHIETIEHMFFDCKIVHSFWIDVSRWLPKELDFRKFVSRKNILLGDTECKNNVILNHLSILGKRYIYVNKCLEKELNVQGFVRTVTFCYMIEKNIAITNGNVKKTENFENKWKMLKPIVDP
jgi:hypothetical protein